jgi:hypothetical protein
VCVIDGWGDGRMDKMLCMEVGLPHSGTVVRGTVVEKIDRAS